MGGAVFTQCEAGMGSAYFYVFVRIQQCLTDLTTHPAGTEITNVPVNGIFTSHWDRPQYPSLPLASAIPQLKTVGVILLKGVHFREPVKSAQRAAQREGWFYQVRRGSRQTLNGGLFFSRGIFSSEIQSANLPKQSLRRKTAQRVIQKTNIISAKTTFESFAKIRYAGFYLEIVFHTFAVFCIIRSEHCFVPARSRR